MMAEAEKISDDEWRLDDQSSRRAEPEPQLAPPPPQFAASLSHARLTRAVYVVTAEHLAWYAIAAYTLLTRMMALGARPLDPAQSTDAMASFVIAAHGRPAFALLDASWVTILQGWIFNAVGVTDASSRVVVMLCGLLLVATAFAMRGVLGRAGALACAGLIATSPSMTYFSRGGSTAIASMAFMMVAIAIAESMRRRPDMIRAAALGVAIALWLSADPVGYATAVAVAVSLLLVAAADAVRMDHRGLRLRVWWNRRRTITIAGSLVTLGAWLVLTTAFFHRPLVVSVEYSVFAAFAPPSIALVRALHLMLPILAFYEFTVVALALAGAAGVIARRVGDRFAAWSVVWAIISLGTLALVSANPADAVVAIVLPLTLVGACGIEWMHQSLRWNSLRYAIAATVALTVYLQCVTNFVYPAPDVSEAPWRRHALLFWSEPATSIQTVRECARVRAAMLPAGATAYVPDDAPQVQWYLRDFTTVDSPDDANIVAKIGESQRGAVVGDPAASKFGFEEWWTPRFGVMTTAGAIEYFFTQRIWSDVMIRDLEITAKPSKP